MTVLTRAALLKDWYERAAKRSFRLHPAWLYGFLPVAGVKELICEYAVTVEHDALEEALFSFPSCDVRDPNYAYLFRRPLVTAILLHERGCDQAVYPDVDEEGDIFPFSKEMDAYAPEFGTWMTGIRRDLAYSVPSLMPCMDHAYSTPWIVQYALRLWYDKLYLPCNRPRCVMFAARGCTCGKPIKPDPNTLVLAVGKVR